MDPLVTFADAAWVKLDLLAQGIELAPSIIGINSSVDFAQRKYFYNSPIWQETVGKLPQELRVLGLVVGINAYGNSPWTLGWSDEEGMTLDNVKRQISLRPELIRDLKLFAPNSEYSQTANLYGGAALAFFSPRTCYFFADEVQCTFCSLAGTALEENKYKSILSATQVEDIVSLALESDPGRIEQVMIVGGNVRDLDSGFRHHLELARAASSALLKSCPSQDVSVHISTMPPRDLHLLEELLTIPKIHVMFNLEVWDPTAFVQICPGKDRDYGQMGILRALEKLRDVIGPYRAHSLLVTGLEPAETTITGARTLASIGVSPIINIYHSDRHSRIGLGMRPTFKQLATIAMGIQSLYDEFPIEPYWKSSGRNSIDAEAKKGLFHIPISKALSKGIA
ncbi:MAG: radical SAM protein [Candidatus Zixiibacteriota bacterium]